MSQANGVAEVDAASAEIRIHTFTITQRAEDLRKALHSMEAPLWQGEALKNAQGGMERSVRKLDAAHEQDLTTWLHFYAALDNVEVLIREIEMPDVLIPGPEPAPDMDANQESAYESAVIKNESARIHWARLHELAAARQQASSFFWMWAGGSLHDEADTLERVKLSAQNAGCLPARVTWLSDILDASKGMFPPIDDSIVDNKPVSRYRSGFSQFADLKDADPDVTHDVSVNVPIRILVSRVHDRIVIRSDSKSLETVMLKVGRKMFTGIELDEITKPRGRPAKTQLLELSGPLVSSENLGTQVALPRNGESVSLLIKIFESATPQQHGWMPSPSEKKYRVLWIKEFPVFSLLGAN